MMAESMNSSLYLSIHHSLSSVSSDVDVVQNHVVREYIDRVVCTESAATVLQNIRTDKTSSIH